MNIFKRLFRIGKAEAHAAIDGLEDPIKMTEQGIRDLKAQLEEGLKSLASVKALAIRARNDADKYASKAADYENKAMLLLKQSQKGELESEKADSLATEALLKKEENIKNAAVERQNQDKFEASVESLENQIKGLKSSISQYEGELKTLKARVKVANATKNINKQLAGLDASGTVSMLERMKEKVDQEEALAESYADMADENRSIDEDIDKALAGASKTEAQNELLKLKEKLGIDTDDQNG